MSIIKENLKEFEVCNILNWHNLGYTGKNIKIANMERANPSIWHFEGKIKDPFNIGSDDYANAHANKTTDVIHQVAPDSDIYILPSGGAYVNDRAIGGDLVEKSLPFMKDEGIHLVNASLTGVDVEELNQLILDTQEYGVIFITSAGNEGEKGVTKYAKSNVWISVAALGYSDSQDKISLKSYSSRGEELDISCFSGLYIHDSRKGYESRVFQVEGTSFSSPMLCGMLALVQQFFLEKAGRILYQDEIMLFLQDHIIDLGEAGWDEEYGYGLFVLPNPDDIIINKYLIRDIPIKEDNDMKFKDTQGHWAESNIDKWSDRKIFNGYPDGTFKPDGLLTRAELATILTKLENEGYLIKK